jgi:hypothetical protein
MNSSDAALASINKTVVSDSVARSLVDEFSNTIQSEMAEVVLG